MNIQFFGAADSVTGSRHLVTLGERRVLLDCGLFQGYKVHRERNWAPVDDALLQADAVVLSHAHLDHSGWLPVLVKAGYRGPIYASPATCELAAVLLLDSAHLQEEDARRALAGGVQRELDTCRRDAGLLRRPGPPERPADATAADHCARRRVAH